MVQDHMDAHAVVVVDIWRVGARGSPRRAGTATYPVERACLCASRAAMPAGLCIRRCCAQTRPRRCQSTSVVLKDNPGQRQAHLDELLASQMGKQDF